MGNGALSGPFPPNNPQTPGWNPLVNIYEHCSGMPRSASPLCRVMTIMSIPQWRLRCGGAFFCEVQVTMIGMVSYCYPLPAQSPQPTAQSPSPPTPTHFPSQFIELTTPSDVSSIHPHDSIFHLDDGGVDGYTCLGGVSGCSS